MHIALRITTPFKSVNPACFRQSLRCPQRNGIRSRLASLRSGSSLARPSSEDEQLFQYTAGRFIHDEARQLADRYVPFNVAALKDLVVATCGAKRAVDITKASEGKWGKDVVVTVDDGTKVVVQLPTRIAPLPRNHIPNQVATMEPEPRHEPGWGPYILTESPKGTNLASVWDGLSDVLKDAVVVEWVLLEAQMAATMADGYGSIFYRKDVPTAQYYDLYTGDQKEDDFVIGPDMNERFWDNGRRDLDIDRGPFATSLESLHALSAQERVWLKHYAVPKEERGFFDFPAEVQKPEIHMKALDRFDAIAPYLIPTDPDLFRPMLRLPSLQTRDLYVSQEALDAGRIEVTSIRGWDFTSLRPNFQAAVVPSIFYHDTRGPGEKVDVVYDTEFPLREAAARRQELYIETTHSHNPVLHKALAWPLREPVHKTLQSVHNVWEESCLDLMHCLYCVYSDWEQYGGTNEPCPLQYSEEELEWSQDMHVDFQARNEMRELIACVMRIDRSGEVQPDDYEDKMGANSGLRDALAEDMSAQGLERELIIRSWPWRP